MEESGCLESLQLALEKESDPEKKKHLAFRTAIEAFGKEDYETSTDLLKQLSGSYTILQDYIDFYLGEAAFQKEQWEEAISRFNAILPDSRLFPQSQYRIAFCKAKLKMPDAVSMLEKLLQDYPSHFRNTQAKHEIAELIVKKDPSRARRLWIAVQSEEPKTGFGLLAEERINDYGLEELNAFETAELRILQADNFIAQYRYKEAGQLVEDALKPFRKESKAGIVGHLHAMIGKALFKRRHYSKAIEHFKRALATTLEEDLKGETLYLYVDALMRKAEFEKAITLGESFFRKYRDHSRGCEVANMLGLAYAEMNNLPKSIEAFQYIVNQHPDCRYTNSALWRIAWTQFKEKEYEASSKSLDYILSNVPDRFEKERATYWLGRIQDLTGNRERAAFFMKELVEKYPLSYYSSLAVQRLEEWEIPPPKVATEKESLSDLPIAIDLKNDISAFAYHPHFRRGAELLRLGIIQSADREFRKLGDDLPSGDTADLIKAYFYYLAGDVHRCVALFRARLAEYAKNYPGKENRSAWRLAYPTPFKALFMQYTKEYDVEPWLIIALAREESSFQADVISPAHATGLTQIMYRTGRMIARQLKVRKFLRNDLTDPEISIRFGTFHLGDLIKRFSGNHALAISSYNAGETAVRRWVRERPNVPMDVFIEDIPYRETRRYTRRVLKSYAIYRFLYTDDARGFNLWATPLKEK